MYDLILRGGTVVDGKRSQPYAADICIREGRIARIAPEGGEEAREVVDVSGLAVAPGFIDIHTHSDACPLVDYEPESKLHQGITTEITGNCGISILPSTPESRDEIGRYFFSQLELPAGSLPQLGVSGLEEYARMVADHGCAANYGQLVGHGTLRGAVMGFVDRDPEPEEMEQLKDLLERELRAGAFGMSLGLIYPPSAFCKSEELVELARKAAEKELGEGCLKHLPKMTGAEDFSVYMEHIPGVYGYLGFRNKEKGIVCSHHHPSFDIDESVLCHGSGIYAQFAVDYLEKKA